MLYFFVSTLLYSAFSLYRSVGHTQIHTHAHILLYVLKMLEILLTHPHRWRFTGINIHFRGI